MERGKLGNARGPSPRGWGEHRLGLNGRTHVPGPSPRGWGEQQSAPGWHGLQTDHPHAGGENTSPTPTPPLPSADHPHAGGENAYAAYPVGLGDGPSPRGWGKPTSRRTSSAWRGPSPRGWGKRRAGMGSHPPRRTIPTRVGKTPAPYGCTPSIADHPHAGGENTPFGRVNGQQRADHPHAGGENAAVAEVQRDACGPSPRGWGKLRSAGSMASSGRTIPTRVGRT